MSAPARIVERITRALEVPIEVNGHKVLSRVYCGLALFPMDGEGAATLTRNATLARRFAERRSPTSSGSAYFSSEIDAAAAKNTKIAARLHDALINERLSVVYQPKIHADTRRVIGVEALARWTCEELGEIRPDVFVELAEHLGLIHLLTDLVVSQVCRDLNDGKLGDVRVSINVSPLELSDATTADRLLNQLDRYGIPASRIGVELTESTFLDDRDLGRDILETLRDAGILVSLDDFGTGYSSLNMLAQIPVDIIKIDRSFISDVQNTPTKHSIVQAIFVLARTLDMRVVAEGVSTDEEYECLKLLGCTEMQGFLFAEPLPTDQLGQYLRQTGTQRLLPDTSPELASGDAQSA
ncbi:MAG: EAL domain-containing protein [Pseudomonadota bacterium]